MSGIRVNLFYARKISIYDCGRYTNYTNTVKDIINKYGKDIRDGLSTWFSVHFVVRVGGVSEILAHRFFSLLFISLKFCFIFDKKSKLPQTRHMFRIVPNLCTRVFTCMSTLGVHRLCHVYTIWYPSFISIMPDSVPCLLLSRFSLRNT